MEDDFFNSQTPSSRIKANIVAEYFPSYCQIISKRWEMKAIRYFDLFAGPGIYKDGNWSTPLLIGKSIAANAELSQIVSLIFNDNAYALELEHNFTQQFPVNTFKFKPAFRSVTVGESEKITAFLMNQNPTKNEFPTLLFFDPWGYKSINTEVLAKFLTGGGNEIFLFVNIKRIQAALDNNYFDDLMKSLFPNTVEKLRKDRKYLATVQERLSLIIDNLESEFKTFTNNQLFVSRFKFQEEDSIATSHFILHFTKHQKGYELVKQIFNDFDNLGASLEQEGCYTFDAKRMYSNNGVALDFGDQNVQILADSILNDYKGKTISASRLFREHQIKNQFCGTHYANALRTIVEKGLATATYIDNKQHRKSVMLIESCILTF